MMKIEEMFPLRVWVNLGRRDDRRGEMEYMLERAGMTAERFAAVDSRFVKRMAGTGYAGEETPDGTPGPLSGNPQVRGYEHAGRYALALTKRLALRRARQQGADSVLMLEDDVVFHPNFRALLEMLELPEDWGILFLGCGHFRDTVPAAPGIVRLKKHGVVDTHAMAVRAPYYDQVMRVLDARGRPDPGHPRASDRYLAAVADEIPSYACFPNLAWQAVSHSDLIGSSYSQYLPGGTQNHTKSAVERTYEAMCLDGEKQRGNGRARLGLLFLTRGEVNHPNIWREFVAGAPERVRVFSHPKHPEAVEGGFLDGTAIDEHHETNWGTISLVRASLALLRAALEDESLTHFMLLSESCVPVKPLRMMLRHLDWNPKPRFASRNLEKATSLQHSRATLREVPPGCWRFQSQWWMLDRIAAEWVARADYTETFSKMQVPDEAYFSTVLSLLGYPVEDRSTGKPVTYVHWKNKVGRPTEFETVPMERLEEILDSGAWFARKFPKGADIGEYGLHRSDE